MPDVTQSRSLPLSPLPWQHTKNGVLENKGTSPRIAGSQTTTSFRSGRGYTESDDSVVDAATEGSGLAARRNLNRAVRGEYKARFDTGHNFHTEKKEVSDTLPQYVLSSTSGADKYRYSGYIFTEQSALDTLYAVPDVPTSSKIDADGRLGINRTIPTKPEVSLAALLGELKERLPSAVGFQTYRQGLGSRSSGSEYLNVEFGLKPLGAEIGKMAAEILDFQTKVKQVQRDSGRQVRRKTVVHELETATKIREFSANPVMGPTAILGGSTWSLYFSSKTPVSVYDKSYSRAYFVGAYQYHLAEAHSFLGKMGQYEQLANQLLGSRITAETVYELTPWSWLLDWQSDVGTFVSNMTALSSDSLVLRYGYVMHETRAERSWFQQAFPRNGGAPVSYMRTSTHVVKSRRKCTPYGFGVDLSSLSPRRWAILGALGMTKAPTALR